MPQHSRWTVVGWMSLILVAIVADVHAGRLFRSGAVGGIAIDAQGVVTEATPESRQRLRDEMIRVMEQPAKGMARSVPLRKVSLRGIEAAIQQALDNNLETIPDEVRYLGGLQRVEYVLVYPEHNDIVLAGPGEGWKVDPNGNVVGQTSGRPVIQIDDLIVALRTVRAQREAISCSIDPTQEGLARLSRYIAKQKSFKRSMLSAMRRALGPQQVSVTAVPEDSHFARVMLAADYRMKRIAMNLDPSPVAELPGFMDLLKSSPRGLTSMTPRWWLACDYEPLARSEDGLAWRLRGQGVKVMTENDLVDADGHVRQTGKSDPVAQEWAELMTEHYDALSQEEVVFGQLRNVMDLCVISAVIAKEHLLERANCSLPNLASSEGALALDSWNVAKSIESQCSYIKKGRSYVVTTSGGVDIDPWRVVRSSTTDSTLASTRAAGTRRPDSSWWWNE